MKMKKHNVIVILALIAANIATGYIIGVALGRLFKVPGFNWFPIITQKWKKVKKKEQSLFYKVSYRIFPSTFFNMIFTFSVVSSGILVIGTHSSLEHFSGSPIIGSKFSPFAS